MKKLHAFAVFFLLLPLSVQAAESELDTQQIKNLLTGNTLYGVHYQKRTVQFFSESGLTLWGGEGDKTPSEGKWKAESGEYCSDFGGGWGCYKIVKDDDQGVYYFLGKNFRAPFVVKKGYHFQI